MTFDDTFILAVSPQIAWLTLMDVTRVAPCLPGARIISGDGPEYQGQIKVRLGPVEMTYRGTVIIVERDDDARRAVIDVAAREAKGIGGAKARISLAAHPDPVGTRVQVGSDFTVTGKAAQFGRGVMEEVSKALMETFAQRLSALLAEQSLSQHMLANEDVSPPVASVQTAVSVAPAPSSDMAVSTERDTVFDAGRLVGQSIARRYRKAGVAVIVLLVLIGLWWMTVGRHGNTG